MRIGDWFGYAFGRNGEELAPARVKMMPLPAPAPPAYRIGPPAHHRMFIVAAEDIKAGQVIYLDAVSDGSYNAHLRKVG